MMDHENRTVKIISFKRAKETYDLDRCKHYSVIIDVEAQEIECSDCGKKLNPIAYLERLARDEESWDYRLNRVREEAVKAEKNLRERKRFKCYHCGKMFNINV